MVCLSLELVLQLAWEGTHASEAIYPSLRRLFTRRKSLELPLQGMIFSSNTRSLIQHIKLMSGLDISSLLKLEWGNG